jgi:hypothetical protein
MIGRVGNKYGNPEFGDRRGFGHFVDRVADCAPNQPESDETADGAFHLLFFQDAGKRVEISLVYVF